jgi:hypothetical protein
MDKRLWRNLVQTKQGQSIVQTGVPLMKDLQEGKIYPRYTNEGIVIYIRYNNVLYKQVLEQEKEKSTNVVPGFSFPYSGVSSNNSDTEYKSAQYAGGFAGLLGWAQSTSSPTSITVSSSRGFLYEADKDLKITEFNGYIQRTGSNNDAFSFHLYKGTPVSGGGTFDSVLMGSTDSANIALSNIYNYTLKPDFSILRKGERVYAFFKKDAHTGSSSYYFAGTLQGEYI